MEGIIVVNKPKGITSFDVIRKLKKILKTKKILYLIIEIIIKKSYNYIIKWFKYIYFLQLINN